MKQPLMLDQFLLKIFVQNAVSNGMKYGKKGGIIKFIVKFHLGLLTILCRNEAGDGHGILVGMTEEQVSTMFNKGTRLDLGGELDLHRDVSAGDGAWLMQACARAMAGDCSIRFSEDHTDLTLVCATNISVTEEQAGRFGIPTGTFVVVVDDSSLQRKTFARQLQRHFDIPAEFLIVRGASKDEIIGLESYMHKLMSTHSTALFLLICDENLDYFDPESGSNKSLKVRQELSPSLCALLASSPHTARCCARFALSTAHVPSLCTTRVLSLLLSTMLASPWHFALELSLLATVVDFVVTTYYLPDSHSHLGLTKLMLTGLRDNFTPFLPIG